MPREQVLHDVILGAQPTKRFVPADGVASLFEYLCSDAAAPISLALQAGGSHGAFTWTCSTSKFDASWSLISKLHGLGREAAKQWLDQTYDSIGREGTLDLRMAYS